VRLRRFLVVVAVALQMTALASSAGTAVVGGAKLTIAATPSHLVTGDVSVVVAGQLTGTANAGKKVVLHQEYPPGKTLFPGGSAVTSGSGHYKFVLPVHSVTVNTDWYVTGPGGVRSPTVDEKVHAYIESPIEHDPLLANHLIEIDADIAPLDLESATFYLEQKVGSSWKKIAHGDAGGTNLVQLYFKPTAPGTISVRIWWPGDAEIAATGSKMLTLTIKRSTPTTTTSSTPTTTTASALTVTVTTGVPATYTFRLSTSTQPKVISDKPGAAELTVPTGEVTFNVTNPYANILSHNFEVCPDPLPKPVATLPAVQALPDTCSGESTPVLSPGGSPATLTIDFTTPGAYEYLSTANATTPNGPDGDSSAGMKGVLNVT
jgi:hypothetical protein